MEYVNLGRTGLKVSRITLGCMTYGEPVTVLTPGSHAWTLNEADSQPFLKQALDLGINFFDTANVYSRGKSEEVLGRFLKANTRRESVVIATKVHSPMREEPNGKGLSRKAILHELDASLRRLGTDYVDLYQTHRWDYETPIEETLEALHDIVKAGKARYIGASSMFAWQFTKALYLADLHGWTRFVSMQNHYNLLYREEEREMMGLCIAEGIGVIPWSPLARGRLARPWQTETTRRFETDAFAKGMYGNTEGPDKEVVDRLGEIADQRGVPRAQIAMAWLLAKPGVTSPIRRRNEEEPSGRRDCRVVPPLDRGGDGETRRTVFGAPHTGIQLEPGTAWSGGTAATSVSTSGKTSHVYPERHGRSHRSPPGPRPMEASRE